jgi:hypothetical protein
LLASSLLIEEIDFRKESIKNKGLRDLLYPSAFGEL